MGSAVEEGKMKRLNRPQALLAVFLIAVLPGCASRPDEQINAAQAAMDEARGERAEIFAPADWTDAVTVWKEGQDLLEQEKFGEAASKFIRAKARFEKTRNIARSKREELAREVREQQGVINARYGLIQAELPNVSGADRRSLEEACRDIDQEMAGLNESIDKENFLEAQDKAQTVLRKVYEAQLKMQKMSRRKN